MNETEETIRSAQLGNERSVWVLEPTDRATARHLVLFLDGEIYRDRMGAVATLDRLRPTLADAWFVFVSMGNAEWRWSELPCHPPFAKFVVEELLPWLARRFPEIASVAQRTLVGVSYSGLAATFVTKEYPGVFQKMISQSGSFWSDDCRLVEEFRTSPTTVPTAYYLEIGTRETQENVHHRENHFQRISQIEGVRRFRDVLVARGYEVEYVEVDGAHEAGSWGRALEGALQWALGSSE